MLHARLHAAGVVQEQAHHRTETGGSTPNDKSSVPSKFWPRNQVREAVASCVTIEAAPTVAATLAGVLGGRAACRTAGPTARLGTNCAKRAPDEAVKRRETPVTGGMSRNHRRRGGCATTGNGPCVQRAHTHTQVMRSLTDRAGVPASHTSPRHPLGFLAPDAHTTRARRPACHPPHLGMSSVMSSEMNTRRT